MIAGEQVAVKVVATIKAHILITPEQGIVGKRRGIAVAGELIMGMFTVGCENSVNCDDTSVAAAGIGATPYSENRTTQRIANLLKAD